MTDAFDLSACRKLIDAPLYGDIDRLVTELQEALAAACDEVERVTTERDALRKLADQAADIIRDLTALVPGQRWGQIEEKARAMFVALRQARGEERGK